MLNIRQKQLLAIIVGSFIRDAQPIASQFLAQKFKEKISSATIRNEMAELEKAGYISQPHTSAGRIPTESAYQFYISECLKMGENASCAAQLKNIMDSSFNDRVKIKELAKKAADFSVAGVTVSFGENDHFYTGLSNVFSQPEFAEQNLVVNISAVIDSLDKVVMKLAKFKANGGVSVLIGKKNPFGRDCGTVYASYSYKDYSGIIALFGPMRMDYQKNYSIINEVKNALK